MSIQVLIKSITDNYNQIRIVAAYFLHVVTSSKSHPGSEGNAVSYSNSPPNLENIN